MADVERIAPPVPTLPPPVGRSVGNGNRRRTRRDPKPQPAPMKDDKPHDPPPDHIDEYV
jgi:hypothetical protein